MEYQVKSYGNHHSTHLDRDKAIKVAERLPEHCEAQVIAYEQSGTYESRTCIWPTKGETYSN